MNSAPFEVVAQPYVLYLAPVGTAFPALDEEPGVGWTKIGTSGDLNYTEDGVVVTHNQSVEGWRALGSTGKRKAFRSEEELRIALTVADLTLEQYAIALGGNTVTTTAPGVGAYGTKSLGLSRGLDVQQRALLVRGRSASAYGDFPAQYEVPVVVQVGEQEVAHKKDEPAALALEFEALEDPDATSDDERFGRLVMANAEPT